MNTHINYSINLIFKSGYGPPLVKLVITLDNKNLLIELLSNACSWLISLAPKWVPGAQRGLLIKISSVCGAEY